MITEDVVGGDAVTVRWKGLRRMKRSGDAINDHTGARGVTTKFCLGGGGGGFMGTEVHLPPKLSFFSDFGHFILKVLESAKFAYA